MAALASSDSAAAEQHAGDVGSTSTSVMVKLFDRTFVMLGADSASAAYSTSSMTRSLSRPSLRTSACASTL
eukprot:3363589-Rhodomonas_salina.6